MASKLPDRGRLLEALCNDAEARLFWGTLSSSQKKDSKAGKSETPDAASAGIAAAIGKIPSGLFILTARHEDRRGGILASWVQQTCFSPPMVSIAVAKGRPIMPLISESRRFGLCQLPEGEKIIMRKFAGGFASGEDPFLGFELLPDTIGNVPILAKVLAHMTCDLVCHMDVEGDHDLFVGAVRAGGYFGGKPEVRVRDNGLKY